jgi:RNA polymerase sigma factor (sigma-70 family)
MTTITEKQFNAFYKEHKRSLQNFIFKIVHDLMAAEELTNDVFMKMIQQFEKYDEKKSSLKTWVFNIASHQAIDYLRKRKIDTKSFNATTVDNDGESHAMDFETDEVNPLERMIQNESYSNLDAIVGTLPTQQAEMLRQYSMGFTYEEIAKELELPLGTVKGAMHLARKKMSAYFQKPEPVTA